MKWEGFDGSLEGKPHTFSMILDAHEPYVWPFLSTLAPADYLLPRESCTWRGTSGAPRRSLKLTLGFGNSGRHIC